MSRCSYFSPIWNLFFKLTIPRKTVKISASSRVYPIKLCICKSYDHAEESNHNTINSSIKS